MVETKTQNKHKTLLDFDYIGDSFGEDDMIDAYLKGKVDGEKGYLETLKKEIFKGLQSSALSSSLFKEKLKGIGVDVMDMYLRIIDFKAFECLAIIKDEDFYTKDKRWTSYDISKMVNSGIDDINLNFSLMPFSDDVKHETITSDGYYFKYNNV